MKFPPKVLRWRHFQFFFLDVCINPVFTASCCESRYLLVAKVVARPPT